MSQEARDIPRMRLIRTLAVVNAWLFERRPLKLAKLALKAQSGVWSALQQLLFGMDDHQKSLYFLTFLSRVLVFLIVYSSSTAYLVPSFDPSHKTLGLITSKWSEPLLRWDSFHFLHIAREGATKPPDLLATGALAALACDTTVPVSSAESKKLAYLVAILSLMSSSPATLRLTPYTEPFFTYFPNVILHERKVVLPSLFRSNGIMLSGYILWGLIIVPLLGTKMIPWKNVPRSVPYTSMILSPFIYHQCTAYLTFCILPLSSPTLFLDPLGIPQWCNQTFPSIYTHAQKTYWDVGLLRYWTPQQIPNFLLAVPPLGCLLAFCYYILSRSPQLISQMMQQPNVKPQLKSNEQNLSLSPFLTPTLLPHAIHALIFSLLILFNSQVQIILRVGPSLTFGAAWLVMGDSDDEELEVGQDVGRLEPGLGCAELCLLGGRVASCLGE
ncbi:hypothetical protein K435DRAFT_963600 [Dendrothele bispora CBS 962.96]|uniref:GPI mannosyltransferase 2 n=1 Tax=Dendrothele bispora (strain CBS 962.96) TaxID=1314807 RepID=A0A4S8MFK8_DENBC|nr:hypothetical protein K435DRAFT_963600 [Dendrothele bispora CBS 962.96]